jgi:hypothetical protein
MGVCPGKMKKNKLTPIAFFCLLIFLIGLFLYNFRENSEPHDKVQAHVVRWGKNFGPIIRGLEHIVSRDGKKVFAIKAAKFSVGKKKIGVFQLAPLKVMTFRDAEIDIYGSSDRPDRIMADLIETLAEKSYRVAFKKAVSADQSSPPDAGGGVGSMYEPLVCRPVKIQLYLDNTAITEIRARKATVDPRRRKMILEESVEVISSNSHLSTDRLTIDPETGLMAVEKTYVLRSGSEVIAGEKMTTDFFIKKHAGAEASDTRRTLDALASK